MNVVLAACSTRTRSSRLRASRWAGWLRSGACSATRGSGWRACSSRSAACSRTATRSTRDVERYIADEQRLGRLLDYAVIAPRLQRLYEWSAEELGEPRLLELVRDGSPIYAWPFEQRHVWRASTCHSRPGYSNASRGLAEAGAAPKAGQTFRELENREFLRESTIGALRGDRRASSEPAARVSMISGVRRRRYALHGSRAPPVRRLRSQSDSSPYSRATTRVRPRLNAKSGVRYWRPERRPR